MSGPELIFASAVFSATRTLQQGRAAQEQAEIAARASERNAAVAHQRAEMRARQTRKAGAARAASVRSRLAGGGAGLQGTPLDLLAQVASDSELAALEDVYEGDVRAMPHLSRAHASRSRGASARRRARLSAGSSLLRGAAQL